MSYLNLLGSVAPEVIVTLTALLVLAVDLAVMREEPVRNRFLVCGAFGLLGLVLAGIWLAVIDHPAAGGVDSEGLKHSLTAMFVADPLTQIVKLALLALTGGTLLVSLESKFTTHVGEYLSLILMATVGMMLLVGSTDLLMIFTALELTSLSLYILTAFDRADVKSAEAALKYFLFGGMSAAFTLYGLSLLYGVSGSTNLYQIAAHFQAGANPFEPLLLVGVAMTVVGLGFKVAVAPFHLWAPDAYESVPAPSAALIASGSKLASFFVFGRLLLVALGHCGGNGEWQMFTPGWMPVLAVMAAASMAIGNIAAVVQSDVKRLMAYSAIAHSGYAALGLLANNGQGISALIFYMSTYGLTLVGTFGAIALVGQSAGGSKLSDFAGLGRREPALALCLMVFMLSLAGIPPLAGFFGKFYVFTAVIGSGANLGYLWLVVFAIATSAVSLYYYLKVLKQVYVLPAPEGAQARAIPLAGKMVVYAIALVIVLLGCLPALVLNPILAAIKFFGF